MPACHRAIILLLPLIHVCINANLADDCPNSCICHGEDNLNVNCSRQRLTKLPKTSASIVTLDLSHNALGPILNATFIQMRNLTEIDISHNGLTQLIGCAFNGMLNLKAARLSDNRLTTLPEDLFSDATGVEYLDISRNLFVHLPNDVFKNLAELKILDASHNSITQLTLGNRLQVPRHIQMLDFSHNLIEAIQADTFEVASRWEAGIQRTINLAFCRISSIHSRAFNSVSNLHDLDLSGNRAITTETLTDLVKELATSAPHLDRLSIAHMGLSTLVPLFTQVTELSLKFLNASFNNINSIPANLFSTIRSLRILDLSQNSIWTLSEGFSDLVNLRVLNVSRNNLESFRGEPVTHLSNLHTLDLSHNKLSNPINVNISHFTNLTYLDASNNFLTSAVLPRNTSNLRFLDYHSNSIKTFAGVDDASAITFVDFSDNEIESLPSYMFRGSSRFIRIANFSKNSIERIDHRAFLPYSPLVIDFSFNFLAELYYSNWVATEKLYFRHNILARIDPQAFHGMTSLQELDLSQNKLAVLHDDLFDHLSNLKQLNLSHNGLDKAIWPYLFRNLQNLATLDVGHNNISNLSESMMLSLDSVQNLFLGSNQLNKISPRIFRDVTELKLLDFSDNPFDCSCDMLAFTDWLKRTTVTILGLYTTNSSAYTCRSPQRRAGNHILDWNVETFECNRSMLYLIIVFSIGSFFTLVGITSSVIYHVYNNRRRLKADRMKLLEQQTEMTLKRTMRGDRIKLSNQEIAEAIQEAIERKGRLWKYHALNKHNNYAPWIGDRKRHFEREVIVGQRRKGEDDERMIPKEMVQKEGQRINERYNKRLRMDEMLREEPDKQHRRMKNDERHHATGHNDSITRQKEIWKHGRQVGRLNFNNYPHVQNMVPLRKIPDRYNSLEKESWSRDHERIFHYESDPPHMLENQRRNNPYIISPARMIPNKRGMFQGWANHAYVRSPGEDYRMDDGTAMYPGSSNLSVYDKEGTALGKVVLHNDSSFPPEVLLINDKTPVRYIRKPTDEFHHDQQRSQSYAHLPQDYRPPQKISYMHRGDEGMRYPSGSSWIGPRTVSQPILTTENVPRRL